MTQTIIEHSTNAVRWTFASSMGIVGTTLNRDKAEPLHRQLYEALRNMILQGQLQSGTRLRMAQTFRVFKTLKG